MNVDSIREYCLSFSGAKESLQWGDVLCFKVNAKLFTLVNVGSVPTSVCFKCTPETFAELTEQEGIIPAPYLGRYKWVLLERLDVLRQSELEDLIEQSYRMVVAKTKAAKKPTRRAKKKS